MRCPLCKNGYLKKFDSTLTTDSFTCNDCHKLTLTKKNKAGEIIEVVAPVVGIIGGSIAILHFFGVENMDDLLDALS